VTPLFLIRQHELYDLNGEGNPCGPVQDLREQPRKFHQREYRVLRHLLQPALHSLTL
jgi:hypothetical protein